MASEANTCCNNAALPCCHAPQALPGSANKDISSHRQGLQRLSNGEPVPYHATLRVVQHEGSRAPRAMSATTRKPPGYIRNESGGMFSS